MVSGCDVPELVTVDPGASKGVSRLDLGVSDSVSLNSLGVSRVGPGLFSDHIGSLDDFRSYVHYMTDIQNDADVIYGKVGSHICESNRFVFDRNMVNAVVDEQMASIFESVGFSSIMFDASLDGFKDYLIVRHDDPEICKGVFESIKEKIHHEDYFDFDVFHEYYPNIVGGPRNPYVRFLNSKRSASRTADKFMDLPGDYFYWFLEFTYPNEIKDLCLQKGVNYTVGLVDKCFKVFFERLHDLKVMGSRLCPEGSKLGCVMNTHIWSSKYPLLPHIHHHVTMPAVTVNWPDKDGSFTKCVKESRSKANIQLRGLLSQIRVLDDFLKDVDLKYWFQEDVDGSVRDAINKRWQLRRAYAKVLKTQLGIIPIGRFVDSESGKNLPIPIGEIKALWRDTVIEFFKKYDIDLSGYADSGFVVYAHYDRHIGFKDDEHARLVQRLKYCNRPPTLDLNEFLGDHPGLLRKKKDDGSPIVDFDFDVSCFYRSGFPECDRDKVFFEYLSDSDVWSSVSMFLRSMADYQTRSKQFGFYRFIDSFRMNQNKEVLYSISMVDGSFRFSCGVITDVWMDVPFYCYHKSDCICLPERLKPGGDGLG